MRAGPLSDSWAGRMQRCWSPPVRVRDLPFSPGFLLPRRLRMQEREGEGEGEGPAAGPNAAACLAQIGPPVAMTNDGGAAGRVECQAEVPWQLLVAVALEQ